MNILGKDILVRIIDDDSHRIKNFSNFIQIEIPQKYLISNNVYNTLNYYVPIKLLDLLIEVYENNTSENTQILTGKYFIFEDNKLTLKEVKKLSLFNRAELDPTLINNYHAAINKLHLKTSLLDDIRYIVFNLDYVENQLNDILYLNIERLNSTEEEILKRIIEEIYATKINLEIKDAFRSKNKLIYDSDTAEWKSTNNNFGRISE